MICTLGGRTPELVGDQHFVAPNATVIGNVRLLPGASVWFNTVVRGDNELIEIGEGSNVQDGCVLHTDPGYPMTIGNDVTVGHRVMLHGCTIGENSLIGMGSTILNGAHIGRNCLVGANSLITAGKSFADGSLIMGSPARVARKLTDEEIAANRESARHYVDNAARYLADLGPAEDG
ncbi:MAG: gamma carbonic anhydrase family protein [Woeseiaceae bacterium]|nr:gamma carbonic anhydrase family protein [Woeseiaceae bacterium]NIP22014.1 gamma carbonic anhydrase family protein [Woeseiaceae bacterium]NIS91138.1 gamma carbonic anhydrase family protein [Woeseiaceae bacterium]